jgi:hypothetical protein
MRRKYAYNPPQTPQFTPQPLSHAQSAPIRQLRRVGPVPEQTQTQQTIIPPPSASGARFKPVHPRPPVATGVQQGFKVPTFGSHRTQAQGQPGTSDRRRMAMGPPRTPAYLPANQTSGFATNPGEMQYNVPPQTPRRNLPALPGPNGLIQSTNGQHFLPPPATGQRFAAFAPNSSGPQRFVPPEAAPGLGAPSRATNSNTNGAQRTPFIPGDRGNFG